MNRLAPLAAVLLLAACASAPRDEFSDAPGSTVYEVEGCIKELHGETLKGKKREKVADDCFDRAIDVLKQEPTLRARTLYMHALHYKYEGLEDHTWLIVGHYDKLFEETLREPDLQGIDNPTLEMLFEVTDWLTFYSHDLTYAVDQENVYRELKRRRRDRASQLKKVYASHLRTRMFDRAAVFAQDFPNPDLPPIPEFEYADELDEMRPIAYVPSPDGKKLTVYQTALSTDGPRVEIVFDPGDAEAAAALEAVLTDPVLGPKLQGRARAIVEQTHWRLAETTAWNAKHPEVPAVIAYLQDAYDWIPQWRTPLRFAFYLDGELKAESGTDKADVAAGLEAIRL